MPRWFKFDALPPSRPNPNSRPIPLDREPTDEELLATDNPYHLIGMQHPALQGADGPTVRRPVHTYAKAQNNPVPESVSPRSEFTPASLLRQANELDRDIEAAETYDFSNTRTPLDHDYGRYQYMKLLSDPIEAAKMREGLRARIAASQRPVIDEDGVHHSVQWGLKPDDAALVGLTNDWEKIRNFVAQKLLPTVPLEEARKRVVQSKNGLAYLANDGRYYAVFPRFDYLDLDHGGLDAFVRQVAAKGPRVAAAAAAQVASTAAGGGLLGSLASSYLGDRAVDELGELGFDAFAGRR